MNKLQSAFLKVKRAHGVLAEHRYTTIAGTLVFFLIMSFVPFLFLLASFFGSSEAEVDFELFDWAEDLFDFFRANAEGAAAGASFFFIATALWSSAGFFYHLRRSGEMIYRCRRAKKGWKVRLSAIVFTLLLLFAFSAAGAVFIGVNAAARQFPKWLFYLTVYSLVLAFGFFAAWLLNAYVCPYRVKPSDTAAGSLFTAFAWLAASALFSVYMKFSDPDRLYGALSLFIVFLLYLYWMMICFTAGVIFNARSVSVKTLEHKKL